MVNHSVQQIPVHQSPVFQQVQPVHCQPCQPVLMTHPYPVMAPVTYASMVENPLQAQKEQPVQPTENVVMNQITREMKRFLILCEYLNLYIRIYIFYFNF